MVTPSYWITDGRGRAWGRRTLGDPLGWVEPQFAACWDEVTARSIADTLAVAFVEHLSSRQAWS